jgi:hypothetical protein
MTGKSWQVVRSRPSGDIDVLETSTKAPPGERPISSSSLRPPEADAWSGPDRELLRAQRIANDNVGPDDLDWLCRGFSAFLACGGKLPLERCLHLPTNERALRRARRDHWLRRAWMLLDGANSSWRRSEMLAAEVHRFQVAKWARWSALDHVPPGANALEEALFEAFRSHERVPGTAMQLHNIAGHCRAS